MTANARIVSELCEQWQADGAEITVLTCHPNVPQGKVFSGYRNRWCRKEERKGVQVRRLKTFMAPNRGVVRRLLDYLSFMVMSLVYGLWQPRPDVVLGITPQFFGGLGACLLAWVRRLPFVLILCDLWPDAVVSTGAMQESMGIRWIRKLELFMYKRAQYIVALSPYFVTYLEGIGIPSHKIVLSLSGVNHRLFIPTTKAPELVKQYGLEQQFVVSYMGTMGMAHNHKDVLAVAAQCLETVPAMHFMCLGDGAYKDALQQQVVAEELHNVTVDGPFPGDEMPRYWSVAHVALVILRDIPTNQTVVPSKMLEAMAMGKPIVLYAPSGEAQQLLLKAKAGIFVPVGDKEGLKEALMRLYNHEQSYEQYQAAALAFAQQHTREGQARQLYPYLKESIPCDA